RKTGQGFYAYGGNRHIVPPQQPPPAGQYRPPDHVIVFGDNDAGDMKTLIASTGSSASHDPAATSTGEDLILVGLEGDDVAGAAVRLGLPAARCVGFDPFF